EETQKLQDLLACATVNMSVYSSLILPGIREVSFISSSEAKQAQPQCLCGVAPFFLYGVMRAILHFRLYFFRNNFRIAYLRNGLDLLRKVVLLVIIRLAAL
ncbi:MAG: hypothetical protein IKR47_05895, partial [Lachnospiraceae bacterium]|nr:hypothetical protein [Lachnospiraceae bacterium]